MEFTYKYYRYFLDEIKVKYDLWSFSKAKFSSEVSSNQLLLRHDVDQSLEKALIMALIENEANIISTYFIYLSSPFYNVFSQKSEKIIREIISLNHNIGLHFDYSKNHVHSNSQIKHNVHRDAAFLESYFGIKVDAVSFHRPESLKFLSYLELTTYPHTYEPLFIEKFKYFSDSRGRWRFGDPLESSEFHEGKNLQILIHPIWWNESPISAKESLIKFRDLYINEYDLNIQNELKSFWEENKK
jgi:hypothetical protein